MNLIEQGETFTFLFEVSDNLYTGLTAEANVLQYPGETPAITKSLTLTTDGFSGTLTSAETAGLAVGEWYIHARATDADEDLRNPIKLYVSKGWL